MRESGHFFEEAYGSHAGWAHSLFFAAELPIFRTLLPQEIQDAMEAYTQQEKGTEIETQTK